MRRIYETANGMGRKNDFMKKCWARYRPMTYLAGFSGMRPSEYRGLPWSGVEDGRTVIRQHGGQRVEGG